MGTQYANPRYRNYHKAEERRISKGENKLHCLRITEQAVINVNINKKNVILFYFSVCLCQIKINRSPFFTSQEKPHNVYLSRVNIRGCIWQLPAARIEILPSFFRSFLFLLIVLFQQLFPECFIFLLKLCYFSFELGDQFFCIKMLFR